MDRAAGSTQLAIDMSLIITTTTTTITIIIIIIIIITLFNNGVLINKKWSSKEPCALTQIKLFLKYTSGIKTI